MRFIFKICQIVAGTSVIRQFHEFFNLIFGGFLTFGTTVCHSILPRPLWLLRAKLLLSFSSLDSSRQEDYDRWYYFLVEKLRSKQKLPVFSNLLYVLCFCWTKSPVLSSNLCFGKNQNLYSQKNSWNCNSYFLCSSIVYVSSEQTELYQNFQTWKVRNNF